MQTLKAVSYTHLDVYKRQIDNLAVITEPVVTLTIANTNTRSEDYKNLRDIPRPGHADYTAWIKYGNRLNMAGGGPFSARMTAPLCIAGGIALQLLQMCIRDRPWGTRTARFHRLRSEKRGVLFESDAPTYLLNTKFTMEFSCFHKKHFTFCFLRGKMQTDY